MRGLLKKMAALRSICQLPLMRVFHFLSREAPRLRLFAYTGELADGADVKIGIQSYKMENGFKSVDFKPFFDDSKITTNWEVHRQTIELTEEATHWQVSIAIKGPAKVWIDGLEVLSE